MTKHKLATNQPDADHGSATARQFHDDIETALTEPGRDQAGEEGKERSLATTVQILAKRHGRSAWSFMKRHPFVSVLVLGAATGTIAVEIGAAELTIAAAAAFAAYKVLREGEPPLQAIEDVERRV